MRPEEAVVRALAKAALVFAALGLLYYSAMTLRSVPAPSPDNRQGIIRRAVEALQKKLHLKSPYLSEEDLQERARRYLK